MVVDQNGDPVQKLTKIKVIHTSSINRHKNYLNIYQLNLALISGQIG